MFVHRAASQFYCRGATVALSTRLNKRNSSNTKVRVKQGELEGSIEDLPSGDTYASFKGIPYAKPPIGILRFQAPLPPDQWNGVREAKEHGEVCPQMDIGTGIFIDGSEDCLFLNVYTPYKKGSLLPVMVWVHGGGFFSGSGDSNIFGPEYLIDEGVILVTINYRLEVLGFLCLDTKEVPGNAGMKDQVAALRWVKENISQFGGDANNVTIFGESAGGCCSTLHMVSPMSQGLGHKFISQSGSFFNEWASAPDPIGRAFRLGKYLGKETNNPDELLIYLQSVPATKLVFVTKATQTDDEDIRGLPIRFVPTVEKSFEDQEYFLPKPPAELLRQGSFKHCPLMIGYNNNEGLFALRDTLKKADVINENFQRKVPRKIAENVSKENLTEIADRIRQFYFGGKKFSKKTTSGIINLESDYNFSMDILNFAKAVSETSSAPVFLNRFAADGDLNVMKMTQGLSKYKGASHADDLFYLFKTGMEVEYGSESWRTMKRMTKMWTNFAKHGNPTPTIDELLPIIWKPLTKTECNFLQIDSDLQMGKDPDKERLEFWAKIHENIL